MNFAGVKASEPAQAPDQEASAAGVPRINPRTPVQEYMGVLLMTKTEQQLAEGRIIQCDRCDKVLDQDYYCICNECHNLFCSEKCAGEHVQQFDDGDFQIIDNRDPIELTPLDVHVRIPQMPNDPDDLPDEAYAPDDFRDLGGMGAEPR